MLQSFFRRVILDNIRERGQVEGAPTVNFLERKIAVEGDDMYVGQGFLEWVFWASAFYLALPPNTYGVVAYPDGSSRNLPGGLHEVPAGVYKVYYVDDRERTDTSAPVTEMTKGNEKLTLQVILRYHVIDPVVALGIAHPVETLMEHIETDVAQYIRTRDHGVVADSSDRPGEIADFSDGHDNIADSSDGHDNKLFAFFSDRHNRRKPLSDAIAITGVELKEFTEDREYVEMRRKARMDERQNQIEKQQAKYQQELNLLKVQHKVDNEKLAAEHQASLEKAATEHREKIEKMEATHEKEKQEILRHVKELEIELEDKRQHLDWREKKFYKALDAVSAALSSNYPLNQSAIKVMMDLLTALREEAESETKPAEGKSSAKENRITRPARASNGDKVEKLTDTLLNLLNPKK